MCDSGLVLPNLVAQLSGSERNSIRSAVTVYNHVNTKWNNSSAVPEKIRPQFKNGTDYIAYKKASSLAFAKQQKINGQPVRPPPTSALPAYPPPGAPPVVVLPPRCTPT